jgi:hypothetical protein
MQLKVVQKQYSQLSALEGAFLNESLDSIHAETQQHTDKLAQYKDIRMKSDMTFIILRVASHLPEGALLHDLIIKYDQGSPKAHVFIDMKGDVFKKDPDEQIAVINMIFSDLKRDKELSRFVTRVDLGSLNREEFNGRQVTGFTIHCS